MARLSRPEGVELHWEEQNTGRAVVIVPHWSGHPRMFEPLTRDLGRDHRVVAYHLRGTGESTRVGPYDAETDAGDLEAVLTAAEAEGVVAVANADAANHAIRVAVRRPDLVNAVVISTANPIGPSAVAGADEALSGSRAVLDALLGLIETSYRTGLRALLGGLDSHADDPSVQSRIDETVSFCEAEAAVGRLRAWINDPPTPETHTLGDRLWWLTSENNPWFPRDLEQRLSEVLPDAHVEHADDGPVNRPDLTAAVVRRITTAGP